MNILGVDFGKSKIGLAISQGLLASPLFTFSYKNESEALTRIVRVIEEHEVGKVVVGLPEPDTIGAKSFGEKLAQVSRVEVDYMDETFTSEAAKKDLIEAGLPKSKRKARLDEMAAVGILQSYLDQSA
jgi:putative Holliday junction resolvase